MEIYGKSNIKSYRIRRQNVGHFEFLARGQYQRTAPFTKNPILTTSSQPYVVANCVSLKITFVYYFGKSYLSFTSLLLLSKFVVGANIVRLILNIIT